MTDTNTQRETKKLQELARDYADKGFRVAIYPKEEDIPAFLRRLHFSPDLLAESDEESHVVEVSSRDTAERLRELSEVVDVIEKRRGWSFVLVMTNPRTQPASFADAELPQLEDLQRALQSVQSLAELSRQSHNEYAHAVLLSAWAVVEGALRMFLDTGKNHVKSRHPRSIVRDAIMVGFITSAEGEFLDAVAQLRNSVAHGVVNMRVSATTIKKLLKLCSSLVSEGTSTKGI